MDYFIHRGFNAIRLMILVVGLMETWCIKHKCDRQLLPQHIRIVERGSSLKVYCPAGLRPLEVDHQGVISSARVRFARYACVDGLYNRIPLKIGEAIEFFCADEEPGKCPLLKSADPDIYLAYHHVVARVDFASTKRFIVLYCTYGKWHKLNGTILPKGIQIIQTTSSISSGSTAQVPAHSSGTIVWEPPGKPGKEKNNCSFVQRAKDILLYESVSTMSVTTPIPTSSVVSLDSEQKLMYHATPVETISNDTVVQWNNWHSYSHYCLLCLLSLLLLAALVVFTRVRRKYLHSKHTRKLQLMKSLKEHTTGR